MNFIRCTKYDDKFKWEREPKSKTVKMTEMKISTFATYNQDYSIRQYLWLNSALYALCCRYHNTVESIRMKSAQTSKLANSLLAICCMYCLFWCFLLFVLFFFVIFDPATFTSKQSTKVPRVCLLEWYTHSSYIFSILHSYYIRDFWCFFFAHKNNRIRIYVRVYLHILFYMCSYFQWYDCMKNLQLNGNHIICATISK